MFDQLNKWQIDRIGKITASEIHKILVKGKGGEFFGQTAKSYIKMKAAEILTMEPNNGGRLNVYAMEWGNAHENEAIQRFEADYKIKDLTYYGGANPKFFEYSNFSGGSPDGVTKDAIIEVKCPYNSAEHLEHIFFTTEDDIKDYCPEYYWQMVANMIFTGLKKAYFISYDPRFADEALQLKVVQFDLNEADAMLLKERLTEAEKQLGVWVKLARQDFDVMIAEHDEEVKATIVK